MLAVSLIVVSKGRAAAPPGAFPPAAASSDANGSSPIVQAAVIDAPAAAPVEAPTDPINRDAPADVAITPPETSMPDLVAPSALQRLVAMRTARPRRLGPDVECIAKVVYHEAANQALAGQLAVAQVILNRARGGPTFPRTVCGVVNQQGQFFKIRGFRAPLADLGRWRTAVAIASIARERRQSQVVPGALFYHAAYVHPSWAERHELIARIGDHIFYR
jgi:spore germination cell wall hydrolase CwlJ-like protein